MQLTKAQKSLMVRILNVFETGKPDGDYGAIAIFHDGRELVADYVNAAGVFSSALRPFADKVGTFPLTDDATFK